MSELQHERNRNLYIFVCYSSDKERKDGDDVSDAGAIEINLGSEAFEEWDEEELVAWMEQIEKLLKQIKEI
ncbi:MAG: hypothetical protein QXJ27_06045 [Thermoplasmata archaeon]